MAGTEFIGSHVAPALLADGHEVVVLDDMDPYDDLGLEERNRSVCRDASDDEDAGAFTFVEGSMTDEETVASVFEEHDVEFVYHEAARAGVRPSVERFVEWYEANEEWYRPLAMD